MYIVRESFTSRPGQASALARLLKQVMNDLGGTNSRVMTDYVAEFNTVIVETEVADLAAFERLMAEYASRTDVHEKMKGYTDMYLTGRREVYRVV